METFFLSVEKYGLKTMMILGYTSLFPDRVQKRVKICHQKCNLRQDFDRKTWIKNEMYNHTMHAYSYACHNINVYR